MGAYSDAVGHFGGPFQHIGKISATSEQHESQRKKMLDPLTSMEQELVRIQHLVNQPNVRSVDLPPNVIQDVHSQVQQQVSQRQTGRSPMSTARAPMSPAVYNPL